MEIALCESMTFADRLSRIMREKKVNQTELSRGLGVSSQAVNQWITGTTQPGMKRLLQIAAALEVSISDLVDDTAKNAPASRPLSAEEKLVLRFKAARWACYEHIDEAAEALDISLLDLSAYEAGMSPIPDDVLIRFCGFTGVPLRWMRGGTMAGMPPEIASRIGFFDPRLLPARRDDPHRDGNPGEAEDGDAA